MHQIVWEERYSLGIEEIDSQHKTWIEIMNLLVRAHREYANGGVSNSKAQTEHALEKLWDYSHAHFKYEEDLFYKADFPMEIEHKRKHLDWLEMCSKFNRMLTSNDLNITRVLGEMNNWLITHIISEDKEYIPFIARKVQKSSS